MTVIAVTKERRAGETRVAATPETVKKLIAAGFSVTVEAGAGIAAAYPDADYAAAGATLAKTAKAAVEKADILYKVRAPKRPRSPRSSQAPLSRPCSIHIRTRPSFRPLPARGVSAFAMEFIPASPGPRSWTPCPPRPIWPAIGR